MGEGYLKKFPKIWYTPNKSKEKFRTPVRPITTHKRLKICTTMNYGQVQPSERFYVSLGTKLAHPEV